MNVLTTTTKFFQQKFVDAHRIWQRMSRWRCMGGSAQMAAQGLVKMALYQTYHTLAVSVLKYIIVREIGWTVWQKFAQMLVPTS